VTDLAAARLYAITPDAEPDAVERLVGAVLRGGADVVQLRHKALARGELFELATRLVDSVHRAGALLIVNDHLDIALLAGADGVHLGPDDLPVAEARRLASRPFIVGASAGTPETARAAVAAGADYIGCGPAFATPIKAAKTPIGPEGIARVAARVPDVPVFAIGGIDAGNIGRLTAVGVRRACVIRGIAAAADPEAATRAMKAALAA
jgi:thiamine-phosphate pyrophosphorylase